MPLLHRATWVLPIVRPPIRDAWVLVDSGRVLAVGSGEELAHARQQRAGSAIEEVTGEGSVAIMPGLVNAHAHLELSWMRGLVPPGDSMPAWARRLMSLRRSVASEPSDPIRGAVNELRAAGTALVGDVTNTLASFDALADSPLSARIFLELLGFGVLDPEPVVREALTQIAALPPLAWIRATVAPHAPYSVSPALLRAVGNAAEDGPLAIHLAESAEEVEFLAGGGGTWRVLLEDLGVWTDTWTPPGCGPVEYLARHGLLHERLLAVHGVRLTRDEIQRLAGAGAAIVTCPRSNRWTGAGAPPVEAFYASGIRVAIGTDSLASVEDLSVFSELAHLRALAPAVPAARLLRSATIDGAEALGFGGEHGAIVPGARADLIAVRVPPDVGDVEEYLVSGIAPSAITWIDPA